MASRGDDNLQGRREERHRCTLKQSFAELRQICFREGYVLDTGQRRDRAGWIPDSD